MHTCTRMLTQASWIPSLLTHSHRSSLLWATAVLAAWCPAGTRQWAESRAGFEIGSRMHSRLGWVTEGVGHRPREGLRLGVVEAALISLDALTLLSHLCRVFPSQEDGESTFFSISHVGEGVEAVTRVSPVPRLCAGVRGGMGFIFRTASWGSQGRSQQKQTAEWRAHPFPSGRDWGQPDTLQPCQPRPRGHLQACLRIREKGL